jgi:hypothetical protein
MDGSLGGIEKGDNEGVEKPSQRHIPACGLAPAILGGAEGETQVEGSGGWRDPGHGHHALVGSGTAIDRIRAKMTGFLPMGPSDV